ncbi:MAG TPA: hypothetical protein VMW10_11705 [Alphaproteobacteria bacterium]|nr:hypothetical protein [Alphaproteobacteria bacterium]
MIKYYFLLISSFLLFESSAALSQATQPYNQPSDNHKLFEMEDPSVEFSVKFMGQLSGMANAREGKGKLSCSVILNKDWAYPNALVTPFCFDAQTNCIRFDLIQQQLKTEKEPFLSVVKKAYPHMREAALLSLYGCKMALEASLNGSELKLPQAGNYGAPTPGATPPIVR